MALPYPRRFSIWDQADQGKRLGIVNDNRIGLLDVEPQSILERYLLVDRLVVVCKLKILAL